MRVRVGLLAMAFIVLACDVGYDPQKVQVGMTAEELIQAVGEPDEKLPMADGYEFWRYDGDNTVMVSENGVVNVGVMTDADYRKTMRQLGRK